MPHKDPVQRMEYQRQYQCKWMRNRRKNDPKWAAKERLWKRQWSRLWRQKKKQDPAWAEEQRKRSREWRRKKYHNDFEFRERCKINSYLRHCMVRGRLNDE